MKALRTLCVLLGILGLTSLSFGQTYYSMSSGDYSQTFTTWSGYATNWNGLAALTTGSIPVATKTTTASNGTLAVVGTSSAIGYDAASSTKLVFLATGSTDNSSAVACDLNLNFTNRNAGTFSFDYAAILNTSTAAGRAASIIVYYSLDGSTWSTLSGPHTVYNTTGSSTANNNVSLSLPSAMNNQSTVKLRFYYYNGGTVVGSPTGSRPKISIDNISVTSTSASASEPTTQASAISFPTVGSTSMTINWTSGDGSNRLVVLHQGAAVDANPADATSYTANTAFGSGTEIGTGNFVVYAGTGNSVTVTGLTASTTYHARVYEFNGSGGGENYLTSTATSNPNSQATGVAVSGNSDIIAAGNEPSDIAYASYQGSTITTTSDAVRVFSFTIRDGGGSADGDTNPTELSTITFTKGASNTVSSWASTVRKAALFSGSTKVADVDVTGETIAFTGLSGADVQAADNGTKTLDLYLTFESAVTDNQQFQFQVSNANVTAGVSGSSNFSAFTAINSDVTGNAGRLEVTATQLVFTTMPAQYVLQNTNFTMAVAARDANNNLDVDAVSLVALARSGGSGTLSSVTGLEQSLASGVYTWTDLQLNTVGTGITITTTNEDALSNPTSSAFEVYGGLLLDNFSYTAASLLTANGWTAHSGAGSNAIAVSSGGLTYANYEGSAIGNAASLTASGEDVNRTFTQATSGSVYLTFMVNATSANVAGDYFIHFADNAAANFRARLYAKDVSGALEFGISKDGTTVVYTSNAYAFNSTHLLILKYTFNAGAGDDVVSLIVDPTLPVGEATATITEASGADAAGIGAVCIRQGSSSPVLKVDGIRVATTWGAVSLPVELTSFTAQPKGRNVELRWSTAMELNNSAFEVERSLNGAWTTVGSVAGAGTSNAPKSYTFSDAVAANGTYSYRLKQIDRDGAFTYGPAVEAVVTGAANTYGLAQNFPNPFNPATRISYDLPVSGQVTLKVYDMLGKEVATLANGVRPAGTNVAEFDASHLPSGLYFYTLRAGTFTSTRKMLLVK